MDELLNQLLESYSSRLMDSYVATYKRLIELLTTTLVPTVDMMRSEWVRSWLGGTVGLARAVVIFVAVAVGLIVILTPFGRHGRKLGNVASSMAGLLFFLVMLYPATDILLSLSASLKEGLIGLLTDQNPDTLSTLYESVSLGDDIIGTIISIVVLNTFGYFTGAIALGILVATFLVAIFYPLAIAFKALGGYFNQVFHFFNAMIMVVLFSPPIMVFLVCLPLLVAKFPFGDDAFVRILATLIGCGAALIAPIVIGVMSYQGSARVVGSMEAAVAGAVDVSSMPPVVANDRGVQQNNPTAIRAFVTSMATGSAVAAGSGSDDMSAKLRGVFADAAAAGATAAGHPYLAAGISAAETVTRTKRSNEPHVDPTRLPPPSPPRQSASSQPPIEFPAPIPAHRNDSEVQE